MIHLGNDIVDLDSPLSRGKIDDKRFVQRVLSDYEQEFILKFSSPNDMLWILWAAKETAYKAVSKSSFNISSSPKKYSVFIYSETHKQKRRFKGVVKTPDRLVRVTINRSNNFIHCVGNTGLPKDNGIIFTGVKKISNSTKPDYYQSTNGVSEYVRETAAKQIAKQTCSNQNDVIFSKINHSNGNSYPAVKIGQIPIDISFSHDGKYVAYAFYIQTDLIYTKQKGK